MNQEQVRGQVDGLFSTPLWQFHYPAHEQIQADMLAEVNRMLLDPLSRSDRPRSNVGGWRSRDLPLRDAPWCELFEFIVGAVSAVINPDTKFRVQAWVNLHEADGYNVPHVHSRCIISGAYYLCVPKGSGGIILEDPRPQAVFHDLKSVCRLELEEYRVTVPVEEGLLLLFPSWLSHATEPNRAEGSRVSIPINVLPG